MFMHTNFVLQGVQKVYLQHIKFCLKSGHTSKLLQGMVKVIYNKMLKAFLSFTDMCAYMHQMDSTGTFGEAAYMKHEQVLSRVLIYKNTCSYQ